MINLVYRQCDPDEVFIYSFNLFFWQLGYLLVVFRD